jgi:hypothetical protein
MDSTSWARGLNAREIILLFEVEKECVLKKDFTSEQNGNTACRLTLRSKQNQEEITSRVEVKSTSRDRAEKIGYVELCRELERQGRIHVPGGCDDVDPSLIVERDDAIAAPKSKLLEFFQKAKKPLPLFDTRQTSQIREPASFESSIEFSVDIDNTPTSFRIVRSAGWFSPFA